MTRRNAVVSRSRAATGVVFYPGAPAAHRAALRRNRRPFNERLKPAIRLNKPGGEPAKLPFQGRIVDHARINKSGASCRSTAPASPERKSRRSPRGFPDPMAFASGRDRRGFACGVSRRLGAAFSLRPKRTPRSTRDNKSPFVDGSQFNFHDFALEAGGERRGGVSGRDSQHKPARRWSAGGPLAGTGPCDRSGMAGRYWRTEGPVVAAVVGHSAGQRDRTGQPKTV